MVVQIYPMVFLSFHHVAFRADNLMPFCADGYLTEQSPAFVISRCTPYRPLSLPQPSAMFRRTRS